jgi:DNA-binding beta-propeller fold protein YncE
MLRSKSNLSYPSLIGMLFVAALATLALVGPATAFGSGEEPTWYLEGEELTEPAGLELSGTLRFYAGGGTLITCPVSSGTGVIENEGGAKADVTEIEIEGGRCITNVLTCEGSAAQGYGFTWHSEFTSGNTLEIKKAYFTDTFKGGEANCSSLAGKRDWHGDLIGEWDDSTGCVTYEYGKSIVTFQPGWTGTVSGELCFTGEEDKELRINPPVVPSFKFAFGSEGSGNGQLQGPWGVTTDSAGNVWVVDYENNRIQKFNSKGEYLLKVGSYGTGNSQFNQPLGIAADSAGNVWVADYENSRIQKFNSKGEYQGQFGSYGTGNGQFNGPAGIAIDPAGNVWVEDSSNSRIQKFNSKGEYLLKFGSYGTGNGQFIEPMGLAADAAGNVWVADGALNRVQKFSSSGAYQTQFGSEGSGNGQFSGSYGVAVDSAGDIWVADMYNSRIQKFNSQGKYQTQFGSYGSGNGQFDLPAMVATDATGGIWVTDAENDRVQKWAP